MFTVSAGSWLLGAFLLGFLLARRCSDKKRKKQPGTSSRHKRKKDYNLRLVFGVFSAAGNRHGNEMVGRVFSIKLATCDTTRLRVEERDPRRARRVHWWVENSLVPVALETVFQEQPKFNPIVFFGPDGYRQIAPRPVYHRRWKRETEGCTYGRDDRIRFCPRICSCGRDRLRPRLAAKLPPRRSRRRSMICTTWARRQPLRPNPFQLWMPCSSVISGSSSRFRSRRADTAVLLPMLAGRLSAGLTRASASARPGCSSAHSSVPRVRPQHLPAGSRG